MYMFHVHMAKRLKVPISTARGDLFKLADLVRQSRDGTIVVLEGRSGVESVALVREARLDYLEDRVAQMNLNAPTPFSLAGSLVTAVDDGTLSVALRELRQAWDQPAPGATTPPVPDPELTSNAPAARRTPVRKRPRRA
jgi:hypothetical protein